MYNIGSLVFQLGSAMKLILIKLGVSQINMHISNMKKLGLNGDLALDGVK